jgi:hypothetical protein
LITEDYFTKHANIAIYKIIKTESIYQSYKNDKLAGSGSETKWPNKMKEEAQAISAKIGRITLIKVENVLCEQISVIDLNCYMIETNS